MTNGERQRQRWIGILGGTFDPVHFGHLHVAKAVLQSAGGPEEVWFVPVAEAPHKTARRTTAAHHRLQMLSLAVDGMSNVRVSDVELRRGGISYTIDTVRHLLSQYSDYRFSWIIGADMVRDLPNWREIETLQTMIQFIALARPGFEINPAEWPAFLAGNIQIVPLQPVDLSATDIRERLQRRQPVHHMLPAPVIRYIEENGLYEN